MLIKGKRAGILVGLLLVGGCATAAPELTSAQHQEAGKTAAAIRICMDKEYLDVETAAQGLENLQRNLSRYSYFPFQVGMAEKELLATPDRVTQASCKALALNIARGRLQEEQHRVNRAEAAALIQQENASIMNTRPRQTNCNRIGTQTFCSTY